MSEDGPPAYDPNSFFDESEEDKEVEVTTSEDTPHSTDANETSEEAGESENDTEEEDNLPRTRARSRSVLDQYSNRENEKGIVLIDPAAITDYVNSVNGVVKEPGEVTYGPPPVVVHSPVVTKSSSKTKSAPERKGPLQNREVEALKKYDCSHMLQNKLHP